MHPVFFYPARTITIFPSVRTMWICRCEHANSESLLWCFIGSLYRLSYSLTVDLQFFYFKWAAIYMTAGFGIVVPCHANPNKGCASCLGVLWSPSIAAITCTFGILYTVRPLTASDLHITVPTKRGSGPLTGRYGWFYGIFTVIMAVLPAT
jgi:hypothetical protein